MLVIDPSDKLENDKTFCFWATKNEGIYDDYRSIISNHWSKIQINNLPSESIAPLFYFHINLTDLSLFNYEGQPALLWDRHRRWLFASYHEVHYEETASPGA